MGGRKTITSQARTTQLMIMQNTNKKTSSITDPDDTLEATLKLDKGTDVFLLLN